MPIFSWSALVLGSTATSITGSGNSIRSRMIGALAAHSVSPVVGKDLSGDTALRRPEDGEPFSALAFKIMNDPFVGTLTFARIYSGKLEAASQVSNSVKDKK